MKQLKFKIWCKGTSENSNFNKKRWISLDDFILNKYYKSFSSILECEHFEVLLFSGLKDKKNIEIYSGDVIKAGAITGIVNFSESAFFIDDTLLFNAFILMAGDIEVIGNIYDNPELASK